MIDCVRSLRELSSLIPANAATCFLNGDGVEMNESLTSSNRPAIIVALSDWLVLSSSFSGVKSFDGSPPTSTSSLGEDLESNFAAEVVWGTS